MSEGYGRAKLGQPSHFSQVQHPADAGRVSIALQTRCIMKTATLPSLRVEPELRKAAESVLREGETLTSLIETAMRETINRRRLQDEFVARGLRAARQAQRSGIYHDAAEVHGELQGRLDARRKQLLHSGAKQPR